MTIKMSVRFERGRDGNSLGVILTVEHKDNAEHKNIDKDKVRGHWTWHKSIDSSVNDGPR